MAKTKSNSNSRNLIILIFLLGLVLRFFNLATMPPALNWDEVSHGYNAYSVLKTGRDEWGQFIPLANFRAYGDYPLPVNLYLTIPSISLFGLNELGIRAPHAFLGALTIIACFFLAQGLGFSAGVSLLAALLVAISPWTFFPSRFVVQSNISLFFITTGMALFFNRKKRPFFLPLAALALGISVYSYHNARIFIPLLIVALAFLYRAEWGKWLRKKRTYLIVTIFLLLVFFIPLVPILLGSEGRARTRWVSIIDQGAINQIIEDRFQSNLPEPLTRLLYNRPTYFLTHFFSNYLGYFSPRFLFFEGGTQYQFSVPGEGVLYLIEMPFFYLGLGFLIYLALIKKQKIAQAILLWLFLAPIPAALTRGGSHVIRATTMLPLPQILTALGIFQAAQFFNRKRKKLGLILIIAFLLIIFLSTFSYLEIYFGSYRQDYSWSWQYGYKEVANYIQSRYQDYDKIFITKKYGEPHEFLLFYFAWDPEKYQTDPNLVRYFKTDWYWVDSFDKFMFVNDWEIKEKIKPDTLYPKPYLLITSPGNYPAGWSKIKTIDFLDGSPAFEILER